MSKPHQFCLAEDYRDHLPCEECEPTQKRAPCFMMPDYPGPYVDGDVRFTGRPDCMVVYKNGSWHPIETKCDGNHGGPKCADPHCWNDTGEALGAPKFNPVTKPKGYNSHPSGIQPIEICRHLPFALGNAVKYVFRSGIKDPAKTIEDYEKAIWYLRDAHNLMTSWRSLAFHLPHSVEEIVMKVQDGRDGTLEGFLRALFRLTCDDTYVGKVTPASIEIAILFLEVAIVDERDKSR